MKNLNSKKVIKQLNALHNTKTACLLDGSDCFFVCEENGWHMYSTADRKTICKINTMFKTKESAVESFRETCKRACNGESK
jgi:hypothetical protein